MRIALLLSAALVFAEPAHTQQRDSLSVGVRVRLKTSDVRGWQEGVLLRAAGDSVELRTAFLATSRTVPRRALMELELRRPPASLRSRVIMGVALGAAAAALAFAASYAVCSEAVAMAGGSCADVHAGVPLTTALLGAGALFGVVHAPTRWEPVDLP